jgi:hypothetical protein
MKLAFLFVSLFLFGKVACADSVADRGAIEHIVRAVLWPGATEESVSSFFVPDAEYEFGH